MKKLLIGILTLSLFFLFTSVVLASFGVSLSGPFKIFLGEVKPNKNYDIAIFWIGNPGDQYGCYKMNVSYFQDQPEKRIPSQWIVYNPLEFCLNPGEWQRVETDLFIQPKYQLDQGLKGNYFSFLEACTYQGSFGACAASKLYFTINGN